MFSLQSTTALMVYDDRKMRSQASFALLIIASSFCNIEANLNPSTIYVNGGEETVYPVVTVSERPRCTSQTKSASCCITMSVPAKDKNVESCIKVELDNQNRAYASLILQDNVLFKRDIKSGETCHPITGTPLSACLNIYYTNVDVKQNAADACFLLNINNLIFLDYHCIKYNKGRFEQNSYHTAKTEGLYERLSDNGQPVYFTN